jgi:hypothetical protein
MAEVLAVKNAVPLPRDFNVAVAKEAIDGGVDNGPSVALTDDQACYVPDRVN